MTVPMGDIFADPSEKELSKVLDTPSPHKDDGIDVSIRAGITLPQVTSGDMREIESLAMNDTLTDRETSFDAIYLAYPRHTHMQIQIDRVRLHGVKTKAKGDGAPMRGLRVLGPTGSGKTTGIEEYLRHLNRSGSYGPGRVPLVYVRLRKKTSWTKVLRAILTKFGERHLRKRDEDELLEQVRNCIERAGVELIVIDECQHLKNLSNDSLIVTDELKVFLDDSIVPVVFVGTNAAQPMFDANPELCGRLGSPVELRPLNGTDVNDMALFTEFMRRLDAEMVGRLLTTSPNNLDNGRTISCLHAASGGVIGMAYRIVRAALLIATSRGATHVEQYDLALAVNRWAIPNKVCKSNPFLVRQAVA